MVLPNLLMITHVNKNVDRPLMNSMATRGCKSTDVMHPKGKYSEPIIVTAPILDHKDGHYVKPNMVTLKYPNFKKDVDVLLECSILH